MMKKLPMQKTLCIYLYKVKRFTCLCGKSLTAKLANTYTRYEKLTSKVFVFARNKLPWYNFIQVKILKISSFHSIDINTPLNFFGWMRWLQCSYEVPKCYFLKKKKQKETRCFQPETIAVKDYRIFAPKKSWALLLGPLTFNSGKCVRFEVTGLFETSSFHIP